MLYFLPKIELTNVIKTHVPFMNKDTLYELNRQSFITTIEKTKYGSLYKCIDLIPIICTNSSSGIKRIYGYDDMFVQRIPCMTKHGTRRCAFINRAGIQKFIKESPRVSLKQYDDLCTYFDVEKISIPVETHNGKYKTSQLIMWLFGKRKRTNTLDTYTHMEDFYKWFVQERKKEHAMKDREEILFDVCRSMDIIIEHEQCTQNEDYFSDEVLID